MNQSIIFPDLQDWDEISQQVVFPAQCQGANIRCRISLVRLIAMLDEPDMNELDKPLLGDEIIAAFERCRFDIEDVVEALIEDEAFDDDGGINLL